MTLLPPFLIVRDGAGRAGDLEETTIVVGAVPASKGCLTSGSLRPCRRVTLALELRMSTLCTEAYNVRCSEWDPRTGAKGLGPTGIVTDSPENTRRNWRNPSIRSRRSGRSSP